MSPFQPKIKAYSGNAKWRSRVFPRIFPQLKWRHSCFYHSTERHVSNVVKYKIDRIKTKMKLKDTTNPFAEFSNPNTPLSFRYVYYCVLCISHQTSFSLFIRMNFNICVCFTALLLLCTVVSMSTASSRCYQKNCSESFHACFSQCETVEHCQNCLILKFNCLVEQCGRNVVDENTRR